MTVLRRSYIPPLMEMYQDISVISRCELSERDEEVKEIDKRFLGFLQEVHQVAVDSMHSSKKTNCIYRDIIEERANALLIDEQTAKF